MRSDAVRNRARVLDAARELLGRDGLDAQMDEIAASAGVGVGTVYRHFATKESLLEALADDYFVGQQENATRALQIGDPWEGFATLVRRGAELMAGNRALAQISADRPELMQHAAEAANQEYGFFSTVERVIRRAQDAGELRPDFELSDIPSIMCSVGALAISPKSAANWRRMLAFVLDGLRSEAAGDLPPATQLPGLNV
ncbi:MAG TPA: helix-turn-helix domain-containing protein [Solirubrobacteraceae bacterium]|jgi:AcrR family transcriptional regulator|nr:helix-turn-helix domain-containing protein [Solirubrobacteraceae bacterium]